MSRVSGCRISKPAALSTTAIDNASSEDTAANVAGAAFVTAARTDAEAEAETEAEEFELDCCAALELLEAAVMGGWKCAITLM